MSMTIAGAIETCRRRLRGVSNVPWLEARILASYVTGLDASAVVAYGENALDAERCEQLLALAQRRAAGEPVAYIVGYKDFCGLRISVDRRVLVPRPETEELVEHIVTDWRGSDARMLELGTGSGAIACALAEQLPRATIVATDISPEALAVAAHNVSRLMLAERIELKASDLFDDIGPGRRFDAIVANLPYVRAGDPELAADVRDHEPLAALIGGADGLEVYRRMFGDAPAYLETGGAIYCECSPQVALELAALAKARFSSRDVSVHSDWAGRERFVIVRTAAR